jgi:hypothetical protein
MHKQLYSSDPPLLGTYATMIAEIHLAISVLVQTASSFKQFIAVYEDEQGLAYTDSAPKSRFQSSSLIRLKGQFSSIRRWKRANNPNFGGMHDHSLFESREDEVEMLHVHPSISA